MRRTVLLLIVMLLGACLAFGQTFNASSYTQAFNDFSDELANALPFNATLGLNWSDGYIGQFPHAGVGLMVGATTIPYDAFKPIADTLSIDTGNYGNFEKWGAPIPAVAVEGRIGGFVKDFDIGIKAGFIPEDTKALLPDNLTADYTMLGFDVRVPLIKEKGFMPDLIVGGGYSYIHGTVTMLGAIPTGGTWGDGSHTVTISDTDVAFDWTANVIDLKAQISKKLLLITPYMGLGATYGRGKTNVALMTNVTGSAAAINYLESTYGVDISGSEISIESGGLNGWGFRVFGGTSVNLWVLKVDLTAMYNLTSGSLGASLGTRIQF